MQVCMHGLEYEKEATLPITSCVRQQDDVKAANQGDTKESLRSRTSSWSLRKSYQTPACSRRA